tara:strand:- start:2289 stop:2549 length:261 start_codon:yes stop_codon:yes gene_type:complete
MTQEQLQKIMDDAWLLAVEQAEQQYGITPADANQIDTIIDLQDQWFQRLGGKWKDYYPGLRVPGGNWEDASDNILNGDAPLIKKKK